MKKVLIIGMLLVLTGCSGKHFEPWSSRDMFLGSVQATAQFADWGTTRQMPLNDYVVNGKTYHEMNPITGRYPTAQEVDVYMATSLFLKLLVTDWLAPRYRPAWQGFCIATSAACAINNYQKGLRIQF